MPMPHRKFRTWIQGTMRSMEPREPRVTLCALLPRLQGGQGSSQRGMGSPTRSLPPGRHLGALSLLLHVHPSPSQGPKIFEPLKEGKGG